MNAIKLALAAAAMSVPAMSYAQETPSAPAIAQGNTLLTVAAEGRSTRKPELAVFTAGVSTTGTTAGEAMSANAAQMNKVVAALRRAGIAERDIQTSNLNLNPVYSQDQQRAPNGPQEARIIGYQANNSVTIKQRNLTEFGKVLDTLVAAGANQVNGPSFDVNDPDAALDEARTNAIQKARARATLYANAAGLKVARILSISEAGGYSPRPVAYRMAAADSAGNTPVLAGEVSLETNVTVQFELTP